MFRRVTLAMTLPAKAIVDYTSLAKFPGAKNLLVAVTSDHTVDVILDVTQKFGPSTSGKTVIIASTIGPRPIGATRASLGFNCFMKSPKPKKGGVAPTVDLQAIKAAFDAGLRSAKGLTVTLENEKWIRCSINPCPSLGQHLGSAVLIATCGNIPIGKVYPLFHPFFQAITSFFSFAL